jgi:hypothetical protein
MPNQGDSSASFFPAYHQKFYTSPKSTDFKKSISS